MFGDKKMNININSLKSILFIFSINNHYKYLIDTQLARN